MGYSRAAIAEVMPQPVHLPIAPFPYPRHLSEFGIPVRQHGATLVGTEYISQAELFDWVVDLSEGYASNLLVIGEGHVIRPVVAGMVQDLFRQPSHRRLLQPGPYLRWTTSSSLHHAVRSESEESLLRARVLVAELPRASERYSVASMSSVVEARMSDPSASTVITVDPEVYHEHGSKSPDVLRRFIEADYTVVCI